MCAVRTKKGKRAHVRQVVLFVRRGRGVRVLMGRLFGSIPKVGFAVCRPLAVHGVDGLFMVFAVDDGLQRFHIPGSAMRALPEVMSMEGSAMVFS